MGEKHLSDLRSEIDELIASSDLCGAASLMNALWRQEASSASAGFIVSRMERVRGEIDLTPFRVAVLRSFTLEPVVPLLRAAAFSQRLDLQVQVGDYNAYLQEILDRESSLYRFAPNAVVVAVRTPDIAPELWGDFSGLSQAAIQTGIERVGTTFGQLIAAFRERSQAALIVHTLEQPPRPALGVLDSQVEFAQSEAIQTINRELRRISREYHGVYVLDYDALIARHGRLVWQDERKFISVGLPISAAQLIHLANELMRVLVPLSGRVAKALVVDLDNTLWGGLIGEDGMSGIQLGAEYPGAAYQALQRAMIDLSRKGVLLAICSKNNPEDAFEVLDQHPGMLLGRSDFAAIRINWNDKTQGLREIAAELNIGLDSLAFFDDNPFEREQVRGSLPQVLVLEPPENPFQYASVVRDCPAFERLAISTEDRRRTGFYAEERGRAQAEQKFRSKEDFYRYLEQEAEIEPMNSTTLARIAQLTQKTNQFNVRTRRYGEQQISEMAAKTNCQVLSIRVRDRFGDQGLVGVAITFDGAEECVIDTFLLSCRVIGRSVERAFMSYLAQSAGVRGRKRLTGWYLPTKKNAPARDFYRQCGFECRGENAEGSFWVLDLEREVPCPEWIKLNQAQGAPA
jgi:FkbH-like protein